MPGSDKEVFQELTKSTDHTDVSNFLTYAIFAFDRADWIATQTERNRQPPEQAEVDGWIGNLTPHSLNQMRERAKVFFDSAARDYMADEIEEARQETLKSGVLSEVRSAVQIQTAGLEKTLAEVRSAGSFRKQLGLQMLTAVIAPLLIGGGIGFALLFSDRLPSIREIAASVTGQSTAKPSGP